MSSRHWRLLLRACLIVITSMLAVYLVVNSVGPNQWVPVEARVNKTEVKSFRSGGPPEWALFLHYTYSASGEKFDGIPVRIFSHEDQSVTEAEQAGWPAGKTFTIYHHPTKPASTSLSKDGGRQAMAVVAALLTPVAVSLAALIYVSVKRRRRSGR